MAVPPVLLSGHHAEIERWRRREALAPHARAAPGSAGGRTLDPEDQAIWKNRERAS